MRPKLWVGDMLYLIGIHGFMTVGDAGLDENPVVPTFEAIIYVAM